MREETGEMMQKLKKVAAVAVMVGGMGLVGGGVASADDGPYSVDNLQVVKCEQSFDAGAGFVNTPDVSTGDNTENIGNFCTVIGSIED
ncbi:hypothetical protein [Streptomyces sp. NPDC049915]|uniref:hypothetical protein n=1 Tax=Streptomyces sp. NPDC049915 TaxID=3155510 RepID=UPI0034145AB5